jgi:hypothetical protein
VVRKKQKVNKESFGVEEPTSGRQLTQNLNHNEAKI